MIVKVCGMRDAENIREVEKMFKDLSTFNSQLSTFMMGFIFWPKSKRFVSERPAYLPSQCKRVGVFVDEDIEQVKRIAEEFVLDFIQLHGSESPEYAQQLRDWKVIKASNIATTEDLEATKPYEGIVDYFLFDTKAQLPGGSGEKFDWSVLEAYHGKTPFLLSGGIDPDDAGRVKAFHHPKCIGIDLNSRFELFPAHKDVVALRRFLHEIK